MGVVSPAAPRISARIAAASPVAIHPTVDAAIAAGSVLDHGRLLPLDIDNIVNDCDASTLCRGGRRRSTPSSMSGARCPPPSPASSSSPCTRAARCRVGSPSMASLTSTRSGSRDARRRCRRAGGGERARRVAAAVVRREARIRAAHPCVAAVEMAITVASADSDVGRFLAAAARGERSGAPRLGARARGRLDAFRLKTRAASRAPTSPRVCRPARRVSCSSRCPPT